MRFAFTEDQLSLRDGVRDVLTRECTPAVVRAAWEAPSGDATAGHAPGVWARLAEAGVLGMAVPEELGGLGLGPLDWVLPLEETGRTALPGPIVEHVAVGLPLLAAVADVEAARRWIAPAIAGKALVTVGLPCDRFVAAADAAHVLVLERAGELHAVPRERLIQLEPETCVDGARRLFTVDFASSPETHLATGARAASLVEGAQRAAALGAAAQLVGLGARMLEITVDYAKVREQFGKAIGSFQAIKHHLADALLAIEMARPVVHRAAWTLATGAPDAAVAVSMAKVRAAEAAHRVGRIALQVHGAIGYSFEYDLHLWMKRVWALERAFGDTRVHRDRVSRHVLGATPAEAALTAPGDDA